MKRINLTKYGFVRWPEKDFSDDGSHFTCYRVGNKVRVSKLVSNGRVFLSIDSSVGNGTLPYDTYSKLPNYYNANWRYNNVSLAALLDEDLQIFYEACLAYEKEYEEAEASLVYPTLEELQKKAVEIYMSHMKEIKEIQELFSRYGVEAATKFSSFEWTSCQRHITSLMKEMNMIDPTEYPQKILNTAQSFSFLKKELKESWYYSQIKEFFSKYCMTLK